APRQVEHLANAGDLDGTHPVGDPVVVHGLGVRGLSSFQYPPLKRYGHARRPPPDPLQPLAAKHARTPNTGRGLLRSWVTPLTPGRLCTTRYPHCPPRRGTAAPPAAQPD